MDSSAKKKLIQKIKKDFRQYGVVIITSEEAYNILQEEKWVDAHHYASMDMIKNGEIGVLDDTRYIEK